MRAITRHQTGLVSSSPTMQQVSKHLRYTPRVEYSPWKMTAGRLLGDGLFSMAMSTFLEVSTWEYSIQLQIWFIRFIRATCRVSLESSTKQLSICIDLLGRCLEKMNQTYSPNGGWMVVYYGESVTQNTLNKSKTWWDSIFLCCLFAREMIYLGRFLLLFHQDISHKLKRSNHPSTIQYHISSTKNATNFAKKLYALSCRLRQRRLRQNWDSNFKPYIGDE